MAGNAGGGVPAFGITAYGCDEHEARLFREMAPQLGLTPTITGAVVSEDSLGLISGNRCISVGHKSRLSASVLLALHHAGVRYISTRSIGDNHIDLPCAERVGIAVETVSYSPDSVADYTLMLMLMVLRHAASSISRVEAHDYRLLPVVGRELRDLTVGVIGTGRIGEAVLARLRGFGCRVLAYDVCPKSSPEYVPLDVLLEQSDVVTLHTPLDASTHHLLDRRRLELMRAGAVVINTGRGALVDTEALVSALERGQLGGAALDVLEREEGIFYADYEQRPVDNEWLVRLQRLPNVLITPHTAYYTDHALRDAVENSLLNCARFLKEAHRG